MATKIFVNLPVKDLQQSMAFFTALGFSFNPQFTDEKAACMILGEDSFVMLLVEEFFKTFTKKQIVDAHTSTEVLIALSADSREKVDEMAKNAIVAGGQEAREAKDHGFMYERSFFDLDGHNWEVMWMDPSAVQG